MSEIIDILECFLGSHKTHYSNSGQITFNCPNCDDGRNKGNLEINYHKNLYSCWSCRETEEGVRGKDIRWLIWKYGSKDLFNDYCRLNPIEYDKVKEKFQERIFLPKRFYNFSKENSNILMYKQAYEYLINRGLNDEIISMFNLGFCNSGKYKGRVIIPSYNEYGDLDYFVGRDFTNKSKIKYLNEKANKQEIIFNEHYINWDASVFLVEGVFDHIVLYNSIPLLGKTISKKLIAKLQNKLNANLYIALDGDAKKSAISLKEKLNYGNLRNKIFIIELPNDDDISSLFKKTNYKEFYVSIKMGVIR